MNQIGELKDQYAAASRRARELVERHSAADLAK